MRTKWDDSFIVVDTREQAPLWPDAARVTLHTGDYSVVGCTGQIAVERKSLDDAFGSLVGKRRDRFLRAFRRLSLIRYGSVVIESTPLGLFTSPVYSQLPPASVLGSLLKWSGQYRVPVYFADNRASAKTIVKTYLRLMWEEVQAPHHDGPSCQCGGGQIVGHDKRLCG